MSNRIKRWYWQTLIRLGIKLPCWSAYVWAVWQAIRITGDYPGLRREWKTRIQWAHEQGIEHRVWMKRFLYGNPTSKNKPIGVLRMEDIQSGGLG